MILLRKKLTKGYFDFDKILANGYHINESPMETIIQYANGNRKKITSAYTDVKITIDVGCFDGDTLANYLKNLTDGEYQFYSLKDKTMKSMNFIVTIPEQTIENASGNIIVSDLSIVLERSSDV